MFLCRVLVGEYIGVKYGYDKVVPPVRQGNVLFDSTVDDGFKPEIYVTYHDSQAYPEYLIKFRK